MSAVSLTSLAVAVVALAVTATAVVALLRTRRSMESLNLAVRELTKPATPPVSTAVDLRPAGPDPLPTPSPFPSPSAEQVFRATMQRPLVRVVTVSYGLQRALRPENRDRIRALMRREFQRRRKLRLRAGRRAARMTPVEDPS